MEINELPELVGRPTKTHLEAMAYPLTNGFKGVQEVFQ